MDLFKDLGLFAVGIEGHVGIGLVGSPSTPMICLRFVTFKGI